MNHIIQYNCKAEADFSTKYIWLVVWNMNFIFPDILGIVTPTDFHIFQRVETTNQVWFKVAFKL